VRSWIVSVLVAVGTTGLSVAPTATAAVPDFRVGIQLADGGGESGFGVQEFTAFARFGDSGSEWAGDSNNFDPDAARIELDINLETLGNRDFRIGGQARDGGSHLGTAEYTDWASEGGGTSALITDNNAFDPDEYRLFIDTRPMPAGEHVNDLRLSIRAFDEDGAGITTFTPWASQGGGRSKFAIDPNGFDPDGFKISLDVL
jgi:hypothetical protein